MSPKNPACSQGQPMGCAPLIPVPMHPPTALGTSAVASPPRGTGECPAWHVCCILVEIGTMVSKEKGQLEPGMRDMSKAAWVPGLEQGAWAGREGIEVWRRGRQGAHSSPSCPPHASFISPLHAHLHPRCSLAGCGTGVPGALTAQCRAAGAVPSLPVSACIGSRALL